MSNHTETNLKHIKQGDEGAYCGAFGCNPISFENAKLCTERKLEFAVKLLQEIDDYVPWGDD